MKIWLNGGLQDADTARIDPADRGFTLGDGLFETLRVQKAKPEHLAAHLKRMRAGAEFFGLPLTQSDAEIAAAITALLEANGQTEAMLRITLSRGPGPRGILPPAEATPTLLLSTGPLPPKPGPVKAIIATCTRRNEFSPTARFKTLNYLDNIAARREAEAKGADEALLLNSQGKLTESTAANLFLVLDGDVLTPPVSEGCLPGIMRHVVMDRLGAATAPLAVADLWEASEAFLTSSSGIRPLITVDGKPIGTGEPGPVASRLT